jgi:hypothetical protein
VLESLELVEHETAGESASRPRKRQAPAMKVAAVSSEQLQAMRDRLARAAEDARRLAMRHFGNERTDQLEVEPRQLQSIVDAKRLRREGAMALEAEETLDGAAVASSRVAAFEAPTAVT